MTEPGEAKCELQNLEPQSSRICFPYLRRFESDLPPLSSLSAKYGQKPENNWGRTVFWPTNQSSPKWSRDLAPPMGVKEGDSVAGLLSYGDDKCDIALQSWVTLSLYTRRNVSCGVTGHRVNRENREFYVCEENVIVSWGCELPIILITEIE